MNKFNKDLAILEIHDYPPNAMKITIAKDEVRIKINPIHYPYQTMTDLLVLIKPQTVTQTMRSKFVDIRDVFSDGYGIAMYDSSKKKSHIATYFPSKNIVELVG